MNTSDFNKTNIKGEITFMLLPDVAERSREVALAREYARTGNRQAKKELGKSLLMYRKDDNIIVTVGRSVIARLLAGDATYSGEIDWGALGTSNTTPTNADTTLGAEYFRKQASAQAFDDNIAYIDYFYAAGEGTGTVEEFGNFIDGTASANTGQMWSHIVTGTFNKSASVSLFVSCKYTII